MQRAGEFIWTPEQAVADIPFRQLIGDGPIRRDDGKNRWVMFRKIFSIRERLEHASIDITADGSYLLFVNDQRVGRGPARSTPVNKLVDNHIVTPLLTNGENSIGVLVHVYGIDTAWYETSKDYWQALFGDGGLYCVGYSDERKVHTLFATDGTWRCASATAWNPNAPLSGWGQGFIEDYDARREAGNWTSVNFDDNAWLPAQELVDERGADDHAKGFGPIRPFPVLQASNLPPLAERIIAPNGIVASFGLKPNEALPIDERLYREDVCSLPEGSIDHPEVMLLDDDRCAVINTTDGCDIAVLVKFDMLHAGYPFVELEANGGEIIEVAAAECYDGEFGDDETVAPRIVRSSFLDGAHLFRYTARLGAQRFEKFEWTSVGYLQLVVRNARKGLRVRRLGVRACHFPVESQGRFECSDGFLNQLWETARHTVLQCSHDAWEDCPGREKRQWVGDGVSRFPVAAAAFGTSIQSLDQHFLQQVAESQRTDGLIQMYAPGDHKTSGIVIPDYSLHYILVVYDYLMHSGDTETVDRVWPTIQRILDWFDNFVGRDGLLADIPHWHFIEWANVGRQGKAASINALHAAALRCAASIAQYLGIQRRAKRYQCQYEARRDAMRDRFWDDERGVYVDNIEARCDEQCRQVSQHANALVLLFDIAPLERRERIIAYITDPRRMKLTAAPPVVPVGEAFDPADDVVRCNSFFSHFLYSALGHCGRTDLTLQLARDHYSPMLASGTSTLWESFDPSASLCHAFSASPLYQLSAFVLGVRPLEPGFKHFVVAPQFCDLTSANGAYPTPAGPVSVDWQVRGPDIGVHVNVPHGISGELLPPKGCHLLDRSGELQAGANTISLRKGDVRE